jgi:hypothetical protein
MRLKHKIVNNQTVIHFSYVMLHLHTITIKLLDFVHRPDFYKQKTQQFFISYPLVTSHGLFLRSGVYSPLVSSG